MVAYIDYYRWSYDLVVATSFAIEFVLVDYVIMRSGQRLSIGDRKMG